MSLTPEQADVVARIKAKPARFANARHVDSVARGRAAAKHARDTGCTLASAAALFEVSTSSVCRFYAELFPNERRGSGWWGKR